jgi:hypothetical protein
MAYSGAVGVATFNALKVVDHAFRRCRLPAQAISSEMQAYALESLQLMLAELANTRTPSWCIERVLLPMYANQPLVTLPRGTVEVLNLNYRVLQLLDGTVVSTATTHTTTFSSATAVSTVGVEWTAAAPAVALQVSNDGVAWTTVGSIAAGTAGAGEISWVDIAAPAAYTRFRLSTSAPALNAGLVTLGNLPQEIPLGQLNRDSYVNQSNKIFPGRPSSYYFQRDLPRPVVQLWPAPFAPAEQAQLVLWRHRQIMDTDNLRQEVEVPARWLEAIVNGLAARAGAETPAVDAALLPVLDARAAASLQRAWDGDGDGSPTQINPGIGAYTR